MVHRTLLEWLYRPRCSSRLMMVCSGNLWSCLKEVKTPVIFDGDCGMALEPMQVIWASSRGEGGHLMVFFFFFLSCGGNLGFPLELRQECSLNTRVFSAM